MPIAAYRRRLTHVAWPHACSHALTDLKAIRLASVGAIQPSMKPLATCSSGLQRVLLEKRQSQSMKHHIVGRYRRFVIEAHMEPRTARLSDGMALTYRVTSSLRGTTQNQEITGDFAGPVTYESESIALTCVDREARALINAMLANHAEHTSGKILQSSRVPSSCSPFSRSRFDDREHQRSPKSHSTSCICAPNRRDRGCCAPPWWTAWVMVD